MCATAQCGTAITPVRKNHAHTLKPTRAPRALQAALLAEREEARLAVAMERAALDEARTARLREREALLAEATAERRRLGEEAATIARASEEARANLLDLKGRVVQHEAAAAAALRQAREEEARCTRAHEGLAAEQARIAAARDELRVRQDEVKCTTMVCLCCSSHVGFLCPPYCVVLKLSVPPLPCRRAV